MKRLAGRISDIRATTVTVPLEAPILHANGAHHGRFVRTIVEVFTDEGLVGLGEMGGGGESASLQIEGLKQYLLGHDPFELEAMRWKIMNPSASLYNSRMQLHAALEFACIDLMGKSLGLRACDLFGGALRERVPFASYLFYRLPGAAGGGEQSIEQMIEHARALKDEHGFTTHKLKGGYFPPSHDVAVLRALCDAFPGDRVRLDPNAIWSVEESIAVAKQIEDLLRGSDLGVGRHAPCARPHLDPDSDEHRRREFRAARDVHPARRGRCHLARHDVLGWLAAGTQSGAGL